MPLDPWNRDTESAILAAIAQSLIASIPRDWREADLVVWRDAPESLNLKHVIRHREIRMPLTPVDELYVHTIAIDDLVTGRGATLRELALHLRSSEDGDWSYEAAFAYWRPGLPLANASPEA